ncbi:hypothetical protein HK097_003624, partial [Rhizophlyctis rosea]
MCVIFWITNHPKYKLVIAANRDEFIDRPALPADYWPDHPNILAGRDLGHVTTHTVPDSAPPEAKHVDMKQVGKSLHESRARFDIQTVSESTPAPAALVAKVEGVPGVPPNDPLDTHNQTLSVPSAESLIDVSSTRNTPSPIPTAPSQPYSTWLGLNTTTQSYSFLTNHREHPSLTNPSALSRGLLVSSFLLSPTSPQTYLATIAPSKFQYNGFNLVVGSLTDGAWYLGNRGTVRDSHPLKCPDNIIHGLSNGVFVSANDSGWPKVEAGRHLLSQALSTSPSTPALIDSLLSILQNKDTYPEKTLPKLFSEKLEQALCPICIDRERSVGGRYGTRTHTVLVVPQNEGGEGVFVEVERYWVDEG